VAILPKQKRLGNKRLAAPPGLLSGLETFLLPVIDAMAGRQGQARRTLMIKKLASFFVALHMLTAQGAGETMTSSHDQAVLEFLNVVGVERTMTASANAVVQGLIQVNPPLAPFRDIIAKWATKHITGEAAAPEITKIYKDAFTEIELREIVAFYKTPTGQKVLLKLPEVMQQGAAIGAKLALAHTAELEQLLVDGSKQMQKQNSPPAQPQ
jgi:uncharacterized protein